MVLTRHGQSTWNRDHLFQGQADPPLRDLGREAAAIVAGGLRLPAPAGTLRPAP